MPKFYNKTLTIRQGTVSTLELIQTLHAQNDKENCEDFYYSVIPGEVDLAMCQPATNSVTSQPHEFVAAQGERPLVPTHVLLIANRMRPND